MTEETKLTSVVAKMACHNTEVTRWGPHDSHKSTKVNLGAVCGQSGENKDFTNATPSGALWMNISDGRPAADFFKPGKKYYVTFTEAPD